jgi:hypothetical protein
LEPVAKKRKLTAQATQQYFGSQPKQTESFADVLERIKGESNENQGLSMNTLEEILCLMYLSRCRRWLGFMGPTSFEANRSQEGHNWWVFSPSSRIDTDLSSNSLPTDRCGRLVRYPQHATATYVRGNRGEGMLLSFYLRNDQYIARMGIASWPISHNLLRTSLSQSREAFRRRIWSLLGKTSTQVLV